MPTRIFSHVAGVKREPSLLLKIIGWLYVIYGVLLILTVLQTVAMLLTLGVPSLPGLNRWILLPALLASFAFGSASAYCGLMLLDRSRMAGFLLLILSASGLSSAVIQRPFSMVSLLIGFVGLALTLSIWNELEGPLPFSLTRRNALMVLVSVFALGLLRSPVPKPSRSQLRRTVVHRSPETVIRAQRSLPR